MGLRTVLLTGDTAAIAIAVGKHLGVDEIDAELLPHQKVERIQAFMAANKKVAMVGTASTTPQRWHWRVWA